MNFYRDTRINEIFGISVIVCTYNRYADLKLFIDSFIQQIEISTPIQLVVVDNNSRDETSLLKNWSPAHIDFTYIFEPLQGLSYARNTGANIAKYEYLMYCDDDSFLPDDYLLNIEKTIINYDCDLYGGPCLPYYPDGIPNWFPEELEIRKKSNKLVCSNSITLSGSNFGIKKNVLQRLGFFNPKFGMQGNKQGLLEERILIESYRKSDNAKPIVYNPELFLYHKTPKRRFSIFFQLNRVLLSESTIVSYYVQNGSQISFSLVISSLIDLYNTVKKCFIFYLRTRTLKALYKITVKIFSKTVFFYSLLKSSISHHYLVDGMQNLTLAIISHKECTNKSYEMEKYYKRYYKHEQVICINSWGITKDQLADKINSYNLRRVKNIAVDSDKFYKQLRSIQLHNLHLIINYHVQNDISKNMYTRVIKKIKIYLTYNSVVKY